MCKYQVRCEEYGVECGQEGNDYEVPLRCDKYGDRDKVERATGAAKGLGADIKKDV